MISDLLLTLTLLFTGGAHTANAAGTINASIAEMKADRKRMYTDVQFLTGIKPARSVENLASLNKAAAYIETEFKKTGLAGDIQTWKVGGVTYKNVIASYNPSAKERLIIGAHYDVCGEQPGADDNASAVAGLLEIARMIAKAKPHLNYRIDFVAYSLEEPPHFTMETMGSYVHAKYLNDNKIPVIGMLCYEMIGFFSDKPGSQNFPSPELAARFPNTGNFIIVVGLDKQKAFTQQVYSNMKAGAAVDVQTITFANSSGLAGLSDHRNYWAFGFPAVMINDTAFLRNPNYHKKSDTIETLNFEKMAAVVNASYQAAIRIR